MQLNGLPLKPDDIFKTGRFIPGLHLAPKNFCNFSQEPEDFGPTIFSPLLGTRWTRTKSGGYAHYRITRLRNFETDNSAHSSSGV
jgi:hypothetical protein